jgi:gamma-glutamyl:cysteine ligase YbdK (ATP-grasp superfamily)
MRSHPESPMTLKMSPETDAMSHRYRQDTDISGEVLSDRMADRSRLHLFEAFGIELEYMIVDAESLDVRPISDHVLRDESGRICSEIEHGPISWSNELTHHVIELKTNGPARELGPLAGLFQSHVSQINERLQSAQARLLPTAVHPWMNPAAEMQLWPHEFHAVYEAFDKIFDCRGHGWANLQSMHINLPFADNEEFGRLHAAIRLLLPLFPALAASSPYLDGRRTSHLDSRLDVYRRNSRGIPSITGRVIPEPVYDEASYDAQIFQPMFADIAPYDPQGVLRSEFLNARGAIARFSRGAIEIRVIDLQECPQADLAIAALTIAVLKLLVEQTWSSTREQQQVSVDQLEPVLIAAISQAEQAQIEDPELLRHFGYEQKSATLRELWQSLYEQARNHDPVLYQQHGPALEVILNEGCLANRIVRKMDHGDEPDRLRETYRNLADCLARGEMFRG